MKNPKDKSDLVIALVVAAWFVAIGVVAYLFT
jgi:hypothetical protein